MYSPAPLCHTVPLVGKAAISFAPWLQGQESCRFKGPGGVRPVLAGGARAGSASRTRSLSCFPGSRVTDDAGKGGESPGRREPGELGVSRTT